ncbi:unnamed protein product [Parascedosporium putredinis]|uniref:Major facilitator superfamily (MFS) profile domain-containing protein n=1 Tax=Parascedosporium putredinis TaxID=1442378 RepID=A0A9P1H9J0_9PEZI|nr:unnamed protein product [Parascedosporium putredinis]CAI8000381.1 unnamed protein product [Parascedosporium putredinis]
MGTFARDKVGVSDPANLVMVLNAVGIIGRIVPNIIAERWTGLLNLLIPSPFTTEPGLYAFAIINGFVSAALQALFPAISTTMSPDMDKIGTRVGMILSVVSLGVLTGPYIAGVLIQRGGGDYLYAQMFGGSMLILSAMAGMVVRFARVGWVLKVRV